jgi:cytochrome c
MGDIWYVVASLVGSAIVLGWLTYVIVAARADLLAFLKQATKPGAAPERTAQAQRDGMGGAMGPSMEVRTIAYCHDTYRVTTADGKTRAFWERNLRLKADAGKEGPQKGVPALVAAGMMGDRADVIFAAPEEISKMIEARC